MEPLPTRVEQLAAIRCVQASAPLVFTTAAVNHEQCLAGFYSENSGSSQCLQCRPGTFSPAPGQQTCNNCPRARETVPSEYLLLTRVVAVGEYQPSAGASQCCQPTLALRISDLQRCHSEMLAGSSGQHHRPDCMFQLHAWLLRGQFRLQLLRVNRSRNFLLDADPLFLAQSVCAWLSRSRHGFNALHAV